MERKEGTEAARVQESNPYTLPGHSVSIKGQPTLHLCLEEAKGLAVFWNGEYMVPSLTWAVPAHPDISELTIGEVLEKFTAKDYLRYSTISVNHPLPFRPFTLRVSDKFQTLFPTLPEGKDKSVFLSLDEAFKPDRSNELFFKYSLTLTEGMDKNVLWDGRKGVKKMVVRVNDSHMLLTLDTLLKKYLPTDYLRNEGLVQFSSTSQNQPIREVRLDEIVASVFEGTKASLRISNPRKQALQNGSTSTSTLNLGKEMETLESRSLESFWLTGNWNEIREKVNYLFETFGIVERERDISKYFHDRMLEERRSLETAMRRRNRSIDEAWRRYEILKTTVELVPHTFQYKVQPRSNQDDENSSTRRRDDQVPPPSESGLTLVASSRSSFHFFVDRVRGCAVEMYDNENVMTPMTGVAFTLIAVVLVCIVTHYFP